MAIPYFGRDWKVTVKLADGRTVTIGSDAENALRVTFTIDTFMMLSYWFCSITIYNPSKSFVQAPVPTSILQGRQQLLSGSLVQVGAGYKDDAVGSGPPDSSKLLYTGHLYQSLWERENVTDFKLTLRCVTGFLEDAYNQVNITIAPGSSDYQTLLAICGPKPNGANIPIKEIDSASAKELSQTANPGAQTFFESPYDLIRTIIDQHKLFAWVTLGGLTVRAFDPVDLNNKTPRITYGPPGFNFKPTGQNGRSAAILKPTVIGVPTQTQDGVMFRVLMDSQVQIGDLIQLAPGTFINQFRFQFSKELAPLPNNQGLYVVQGIRHVGDSRGRGDDWYTEITGLTRGFFNYWLEGNESTSDSQPARP